ELPRRAPHLPTLSFPRKREPRGVSRETTHQRHHLDIAFNDCRRWVPAFAGMTRIFESRAKLKPTRRRDNLTIQTPGSGLAFRRANPSAVSRTPASSPFRR